ncbi:phosphotransferase enzyme family protein [Neobacillus sp. NPDC093182]|uniref:phosphotransferase enzyme family protein n=1 Tax=Neobacillus sp. NPDC093182 TaxID=3364297 RepID=UPI0037FCDEF8
MRDLRRVCREFRIGRLQEVEGLLGGGYINGNLKIRTTKGNFVVRIFLKEVAEESLKYAYSIVSKLAKEGVPALLPLLNSQGVTHTRYKEFVVEITPFVEASRFHWVPEQAYYSGKTLRRMHDTLIGMENSPKPTGVYQYYQLDPAAMMEELIKNGHTLPSHEGTAFDEYFSLLEPLSIDTSNLPKTIIHGDWNPSNQLYDENNEVCSFMDFDTLQQGERVLDVAYALYFFLIQRRNEMVTQEFLKGYGALTQQEIHVLPSLIAKIGLYFGILVKYGEFQFERNLDQLKWVISEQGRNTVQEFCIRDS